MTTLDITVAAFLSTIYPGYSAYLCPLCGRIHFFRDWDGYDFPPCRWKFSTDNPAKMTNFYIKILEGQLPEAALKIAAQANHSRQRLHALFHEPDSCELGRFYATYNFEKKKYHDIISRAKRYNIQALVALKPLSNIIQFPQEGKMKFSELMTQDEANRIIGSLTTAEIHNLSEDEAAFLIYCSDGRRVTFDAQGHPEPEPVHHIETHEESLQIVRNCAAYLREHGMTDKIPAGLRMVV